MPKYKKVRPSGDITDTKSNLNDQEDHMVDLLDQLDMFRALSPEIRKALQNKDVKAMLRATTPWAMARMVHLAQTATSDQSQIAALKDILDRGGFKPVEKQAVLNMNELTEAEIDAQIKGLLQKDLKDVYPKADTRGKGKATDGSSTEEEPETGDKD